MALDRIATRVNVRFCLGCCRSINLTDQGQDLFLGWGELQLVQSLLNVVIWESA
jgi:hypothetical protein